MKISDTASLAGVDVDNATDVLPIVDDSETGSDRNKKITVAELLTALGIPTAYTDEMARDALGTALTAGTGISISVNDGGDTITITNTAPSAGTYTDENARDAIGAALTAGSGINITVNDGGDTITIDSTVTPYTDEMARDALGTALVAGTGITVTPNDGSDTITIASTVTAVSFAVASDLNTGTDTAKAVNSDSLAGSNFGKRVVQIQVTDPAGSALTTGDGKAYFRVPSAFDGMNLIAVSATVITVSTSGLPTIQIANVTDGVDMLTTKLSIDANETDSATATTAAVIDGSHDDVATADLLRIDCDVAGTGAKGLIVTLTFQLP